MTSTNDPADPIAAAREPVIVRIGGGSAAREARASVSAG
jgi:hypothetical protein